MQQEAWGGVVRASRGTARGGKLPACMREVLCCCVGGAWGVCGVGWGGKPTPCAAVGVALLWLAGRQHKPNLALAKYRLSGFEGRS